MGSVLIPYSVSVEDAYKCKRAINVPGVSVDVRRTKVREKHAQNAWLTIVKAAAKFYSGVHDRRVTVLDNEVAELPLRLTGDGVRIVYASSECCSIHFTALAYQVSSR